MKLGEVHFQALLQRIRHVLEKGKKLVVLGWRDSNHDSHTREISREGLVVFCHEAPSKLGSNVGLVISNKFISHKDLERIRVHTQISPGILSNGEIKRLLRACSDLTHPLVAKPLFVPVVPSKKVEAPRFITLTIPEVEKPLTALLDQGPKQEIEVESEPIKKFAQLFKTEAAKSQDGFVGKKVVGKLLREAGIDAGRNSVLVAQGWLEPCVSEGSRNVGKYRATSKLRELEGGWSEVAIPVTPVNQSTTDPLARAQLLVAERAQVENEISLHENAILELREKLERIKKAEGLLAQLRDLI